MFETPEQQQMARQVRALYNYNVGQKAVVGKLLIWVFAACCLVFFLATIGSMTAAVITALQSRILQ